MYEPANLTIDRPSTHEISPPIRDKWGIDRIDTSEKYYGIYSGACCNVGRICRSVIIRTIDLTHTSSAVNTASCPVLAEQQAVRW
jgi:hypothetical protein